VTPCDYQGCGKDSTHRAVLLVTPAAGIAPTEVAVDWFACHRHRRVAGVDDILTDDGWNYIVQDHKRRGRIPPAREHTIVRFRRL
jgi:hypothetical protein